MDRPADSQLVPCGACGVQVPAADAFGVAGDWRCPECAAGVRRRLAARVRPQLASRRPIATVAVLGVAVALFVAEHFFRSNPRSPAWAWYADLYQSAEIWTGAWWKHLTSAFLHGGMLHIGMNGLMLWQLGQIFEVVWGRLVFLTVLLAAAWVGAATSWAFSAPIPTVGLSGGLFGLCGFLIAVRKRDPIAAAVANRRFIHFLLAYSVVVLVLTQSGTLNISNSGHAGGFVAGFAIGQIHGRLPRLVVVAAAVVLTLAATWAGSTLTFGSFEDRSGERIPREQKRREWIEYDRARNAPRR